MSAIAPVLDPVALLRRLHAEGRVLLHGVSWEAYKTFLDGVGERSLPHTYDGRSLELMSKSRVHETYKCLLGRLVEVWADEHLIPLAYGREMTLMREDLQRGVEGDECYWVGDLSRLHDSVGLDLSRDPPPDLVIEAEVSGTVLSRLGVYSAMRVPEVWRAGDAGVRVGLRRPDGEYEWGERSAAFPTLPLAEVLRFLQQAATTRDHLGIVRAFRAWVRQQRETQA